jgi:hypothetical protein
MAYEQHTSSTGAGPDPSAAAAITRCNTGSACWGIW